MIASPGMTETNILGSDRKLVEWLFTVTDKDGNRYYWSFADVSIDSETGDLTREQPGVVNQSGVVNDAGGDNQDGTLAFNYKVIRCSPLTLTRPTAEQGILGPSDITFDISNKDNTFLWSDFIGGTVWIHISISDHTNSFRARNNRFRIKDCKPGYQTLTFQCEDFIQQYLRGMYPNTRYVKDLFPSTDTDIDDDLCVPEPYGVAYIPTRSVFIGGSTILDDNTISFVASADGEYAQINDSGNGLGEFEKDRFITITGDSDNNGAYYVFTATDSRLELHTLSGITDEGEGDDVVITQGQRFYVLGDIDNSYTIDKVHSPRSSGKKSEWQDLGWTLSGSGTSEYYAVSKHGGNPYLLEPKDWSGIARLTLNNIVVDVGTLGSLAASEWAYGDNDSLGYPTVYVRTSGSADPDTLSDNYVLIDTPFNQYTKADADAVDWRVVQFMIADTDRDGVADANGLWRPGDRFLDVPTKFSRSDTVNLTSPALLIYQVLQNLGISVADLDSFSFLVAAQTMANYSLPLQFNGAFWRKKDRVQVLSSLLVQCNCILVSEEKISLKILSKVSQKEFFKSHNLTGSTYNWLASGSGTDEYHCVLAAGNVDPSLPEPSTCKIFNKSATRNIPGGLSEGQWGHGDTDALGYNAIYVRLIGGADPDTLLDDNILLPGDILKNQDQGPGTFVYNTIVDKDLDDAGYFSWQNVDEPKDQLIKKLMAIGASATTISGSVLEFDFLNDSRDAQQAAKITLNRTLGKIADINFDTKMSCILLQPGDVVSPNHDDYGGSYDVIIDTISIEKTETSSRISFSCGKYTNAFSDWDDTSPDVIEVGDDDTVNVWQPAEAGPATNQELARSSFQVWGSPYLYVGPTENQGQYTDIQEAINALSESRHNGIYLLNGIHQLPIDGLKLPDRDVEIIGESQGGTILHNVAGSNGIVVYNRTKTYSFHNFTIESQNDAVYTYLIYIYGDTASQNTSNVYIEQLYLNLKDNGTMGSEIGDYGIFANKGESGLLQIKSCRTLNGSRPIYVFIYDNIAISKNKLLQPQDYGIFSILGGRHILENNFVIGFEAVGINCSAMGAEISGNQLVYQSSATPAATVVGIEGTTQEKTISSNTVKIINANANAQRFEGIAIQGGQSIVGGNIVIIAIESSNSIVRGLNGSAANDARMESNSILLKNSNHVNESVGIFQNRSRSTISGNGIEMLDNVNDIGIQLSAAADNNSGSDNITYNVGTSVDDTAGGAGNTVTAKDV